MESGSGVSVRSEILLSTLNSTYQHASFGLRYLRANLGELKERSHIVEFTIKRNTREIAAEILAFEPRILGLGVYIWNTQETLEVVRILKKVRPELIIVLGGPEVSYESEGQDICHVADYVVKGEGDFLFRELCQQILTGQLPPNKFISGVLPDIATIALPYDLYNDEDVKNRVIYVEASRGCPYKCEYCLSSLDKSVRNFPLEPFLAQMQMLLDRGVRQFKFIDRTFNLSPKISGEILRFFLERVNLGLFLHFEMVPDRLPGELRALIERFPAGSLQFEIGIQTFNPAVAQAVSRKNDLEKVAENFAFLREKTKVHTHADLIVGLPGETLESFGQGFDRLYGYRPDEIQVGLLKRLKGTPIIRHDQTYGMVYQDHAPFQILQTKALPFSEVQLMVQFAKFWDSFANSGHFSKTLPLLLEKKNTTPFEAFLRFVKFLMMRFPGTQIGISLEALCEALYDYLLKEDFDVILVRDFLRADYGREGKRTLPKFLWLDHAEYKSLVKPKPTASPNESSHIPLRQLNHAVSK
jgi:radical SAM superfamily enzyme YgiQ (UPF0313 family)